MALEVDILGMQLKKQIEDAARHALKNQESLLLSTLRMLLSSIRNREIEKRTKLSKEGKMEDLEKLSELSDEEVVAVIRSEVKKRKDSIVEFEKGGRKDLVDREATESKILESYLPSELSDEEIERAARDVIKDLGEVTLKDFGRVMGGVMKRVQGKAGGDRVAAVVKRILT